MSDGSREAGVEMAEVSQFLGHRSIAMTEKVYARFSPDYLRRAAGALELGLRPDRRRENGH